MNNKWIDVKKELPPFLEDVLVYGSYEYEIFKKAADGTMTSDGLKKRQQFWVAAHFGDSLWTYSDGKNVEFWQPLPQPPGSVIEPEQEEERHENQTIYAITIGDLEKARDYAEEMANGDQNPELYSSEATALGIALNAIKNAVGIKYSEHHWFWRKDWENT